MTDCLAREFRAQLTTAMDSVLRRAVFEITQLFETSLHDHQMELAQRGEEVAQLRVKLQAAELRLRERGRGGDGPEEAGKARVIETRGELGVILSPTGQTPDDPGIDFEVPDDWCAPLGSEAPAKQDEDDACPSVRLRPLMIPLWRIPVIKQEEDDCDIDSHQQTNHVRRSRRGFPLNNLHKDTQDKSTQMHDQGAGCQPVKRDVRNLLQDIKREYCDRAGGMGLRTRGASLAGGEQGDAATSREDGGTLTATEPIREESGEKRYSCKFCKKVFDTVFGRSVHVRLHRRCRGCKKEFPFPSILGRHKPFCKKFKLLLAKEAPRADPPRPQPRGGETPAPANGRRAVRRRWSRRDGPSVQEARPAEKRGCARCGKKSGLSCGPEGRACARGGDDNPFPRGAARKKLRVDAGSRRTSTRRDRLDSGDGDLARTEPGDDGGDWLLPGRDAGRAVDADAKPTNRWQTMGVQRANGFSCSTCHKLVADKYLLIEHVRIHTGERPLKCERCRQAFRTRQQLSYHRKKCHYLAAAAAAATTTRCEKCKMRVLPRAKFHKHAPDCPESRPNVCKVCGRGFHVKGRLRNHMQRCHS